MAFAAINGIDLYYEVHGPALGTAPVILFAHGAGGNHLSWWQQVPHFRERFTCVTYDQRGWGRSEDTTGELVTRFTDDLEALLDSLGIAKATLVAQSMGGWPCLGLALRAPARVTRLVMSDTHGGTYGPEIPALSGGPQPDPKRGYHPACGETLLAEQPILNFLYWQITGLNPEYDQARRRQLVSRDVTPSSDLVRTLPVPTLFIAGEEDVVIPPAVVQATAALVSGAKFVTVPRSGHSVHFDRATQWNAIVDEFIAETE